MNTMSPKIAAAVVQVAKNIKRLGKDGTNEHGKYHFTSVDAFYAAVGPLMAEAGLFTLADVTRCETFEVVGEAFGKEKKVSYLTMEFDIFLVHESGEMSGAIKREVTVISAGPQAYASAESFVTKYFIRNLFKVPTGEHDADSDAKSDVPMPVTRKPASKPASKPAEAPDMPAMKPVLEFVAKVNEFLDTEPDAGALFAYEGGDGINARMKKIRGDQYSAVPAVQELLKRMNAIYASASDAEE